MGDQLPVGGLCDPRFAAVREAFVTNFTARGDVGAAVAIAVGGRAGLPALRQCDAVR